MSGVTKKIIREYVMHLIQLTFTKRKRLQGP